jgi:magnesium chelatase family protein
MSLSIIHSRAIAGLRALPVQVEADLANGLPNFSIVGLPDTAVREARDRVRAAITNSGFDFPQRRVTVNLAPADLPKDSGRFDLPIALGILVASGQIKSPHLNSLISRCEFVG